MDGNVNPTTSGTDKRVLRATMRAVRKALGDVGVRSESIWAHVESLDAVHTARYLLAFESVVGEPSTASFIDRRRGAGCRVECPEARPTAPLPPDVASIDVVVLPGLAFTADGARLGQGGGWYDRLLAQVRPDCVTIGVCFAEQLVDHVPSEPHDVDVDVVVTDDGVIRLR